MQEPRTMLHADMDAFFAAVEQRDHPEYRGQPVIVGGLGRRGVVSTASYEARRFGVHSALPTSRARKLCPHGIYLRPRIDVYAEIAREIHAIFAEYTPLVEPLSLDEAFLDVTGSKLLYGDGQTIGRQIRERVHRATGLTISVGVATTKFVAKVASDVEKPDALVVVPPGTEVEFLGRLPVKCLWGAGVVTQERFRRLGLLTIGDVQELATDQLVDLFGEAMGRHFAAICRGSDPRPVVSERGAKSISHEVTFDVDIQDSDECKRVLLTLAEKVGRRLRRSALVGGTVRLKLRFPPFKTLTRQVKLETPTCDDLVVYRHVSALFETACGDRPVRLLGVGVSNLLDAAAVRQQLRIFESSSDKGRRVLDAMDAIRERFGEDSIGHGGIGFTGERPDSIEE